MRDRRPPWAPTRGAEKAFRDAIDSFLRPEPVEDRILRMMGSTNAQIRCARESREIVRALLNPTMPQIPELPLLRAAAQNLDVEVTVKLDSDDRTDWRPRFTN